MLHTGLHLPSYGYDEAFSSTRAHRLTSKKRCGLRLSVGSIASPALSSDVAGPFASVWWLGQAGLLTLYMAHPDEADLFTGAPHLCGTIHRVGGMLVLERLTDDSHDRLVNIRKPTSSHTNLKSRLSLMPTLFKQLHFHESEH